MKFFKLFFSLAAVLCIALCFFRLFTPKKGGYASHDFNEEWIA